MMCTATLTLVFMEPCGALSTGLFSSSKVHAPSFSQLKFVQTQQGLGIIYTVPWTKTGLLRVPIVFMVYTMLEYTATRVTAANCHPNSYLFMYFIGWLITKQQNNTTTKSAISSLGLNPSILATP